MTGEIEYHYTEQGTPTYDELVEAMKHYQLKATEILIRLNESPIIKTGEIPAPSWTSHCDGQGE